MRANQLYSTFTLLGLLHFTDFNLHSRGSNGRNPCPLLIGEPIPRALHLAYQHNRPSEFVEQTIFYRGMARELCVQINFGAWRYAWSRSVHIHKQSLSCVECIYEYINIPQIALPFAAGDAKAKGLAYHLHPSCTCQELFFRTVPCIAHMYEFGLYA